MVVELSDIARRGGIQALVGLSRVERMTMAEFEAASGLTAGPAKNLRVALETMGLLASEEVPVRGLHAIHVSLTPFGREVAQHLAAAAESLQKGPGKKRR